MKKILVMLLASMMVVSLAACGSGGSTEPDPAVSQQQEQSVPDDTPSDTIPVNSDVEDNTADDYTTSVLNYVKSRHNENTFIYYRAMPSGLVTVYACDADAAGGDACIVTSYWGYNGRPTAYERDKEAELIGNNVERASVDVTWNDDLLCYSYETESTWTTVENHAQDYTVAQEQS